MYDVNTGIKRLLPVVIALGALTSGAAHAQSSVQLYGVIDAWAGAQKALGGKTAATEGSGGMTTPYWGMRGTEDLGGGNSAIFELEDYFKSNTGAYGRYAGDSFFSRNAWVGLQGPWGRAIAGQAAPPLYFESIQYNPFGNSFVFSPINIQTYSGKNGQQGVADGGEWSNSVSYRTPGVSGITGDAMYAFGNDAGHPGENKWSGQLSYERGPFSATAVYQQIKYNQTVGDLASIIPGLTTQSAAAAAIKYNFNIFTVYAQYLHVSDAIQTGNVDVNTGQLGVTIPVGVGKIMASDAFSDSSGNGSMTRNTWAIGYDYPLSRRTDVYAAFLSDRATKYTSGETFGGGIRTTF